MIRIAPAFRARGARSRGRATSDVPQATRASTSVTRDAPRAIGFASRPVSPGRTATTTAPTSITSAGRQTMGSR